MQICAILKQMRNQYIIRSAQSTSSKYFNGLLCVAVIFIPALIPWMEMQSIIFFQHFFSVVVIICISYCAFVLMCIMVLLWFFCLSFCATMLESLLKSFMRNIKIFSQETTCHLSLLFFLLRIFSSIFHGNKIAGEK